MRRSNLAFVAFVFALALAPTAHAADPAPLAPGAASAAEPVLAAAPPPAAAAVPAAVAPARTAAPSGVAVVAMAGATDVAWPLAQSVYRVPSLRPYAVDEVYARVLCGEPAPASSPADVHDLADTVAAVRGEDAPSRAVLTDIARRLNVRALVVVQLEAGRPLARVFVADGQSFDAASYAPDAGASPTAWAATTASLARAFGASAVASPALAAPPLQPGPAPGLATREEPALGNAPPKPKAFYESGWFWGALGAAAFAGGAVFFATRDNGPTSIHLDMQVPH